MKISRILQRRFAPSVAGVFIGLLLIHYLNQKIAPQDRFPIIKNFSLYDQRGRFHELFYYSDAKSITLVASSLRCGWLFDALRSKGASQEEFKDSSNRDIIFLIDADDHYDRTHLSSHFNSKPLDIPILKDDTQWVSFLLGLSKCGDSVRIDPKSWKIIGREQLIPAPPNVAMASLPIDFKITTAANYSRDIAPIFIKKCASCHREGGIAPWAMSSVDKLRGWAPMIQEVLLTKRMPPWGHDSDIQQFSNVWSLSKEEGRSLLSWINSGATNSSGPDPLVNLNSTPPHNIIDSLGKPDLVVDLPEIDIQANGTLDWVDVPFSLAIDRDHWVRLAAIRPSEPKNLHHAYLFIDFPESKRGLQPNWHHGWRTFFASFFLTSATSQYSSFQPVLSNSVGKRLPRGSSGKAQLHLVTTGKRVKQKIQLLFYFHREKPKYDLFGDSLAEHRFIIPPHEKEFEMRVEKIIEEDISIVELFSHMHARGKWMRLEHIAPTGLSETIFSIPKFSHNWQQAMRLKTPIQLRKGSKLIASGAFDNSKQNRNNPDPSAFVSYGTSVDDEMFFLYYFYTKSIDR